MTRALRNRAGLTAVRIRRHATAVLLAGSLVALASCSDDGSKAPSPDPSESRGGRPSTSPSSTADPEKAEILAAYTQSWDARTEAYSKASVTGTDLKKTTTLRALFDIENDLTTMRKAGQVATGKPVIHPQVETVTAGKIRTARVTDCVDTTNWTLIDKASKKPVPLPTARLIKYVSTATLEKWGKTWMVTKFAAQDQSC
ncbi:hypothetical protein ACWCQ1_40775 [Streptomyces sp. NPDC002144]